MKRAKAMFNPCNSLCLLSVTMHLIRETGNFINADMQMKTQSHLKIKKTCCLLGTLLAKLHPATCHISLSYNVKPVYNDHF